MREAERRISDFKPQTISNAAWDFAKEGLSDAQLFTALARVAEQFMAMPPIVANTSNVGGPTPSPVNATLASGGHEREQNGSFMDREHADSGEDKGQRQLQVEELPTKSSALGVKEDDALSPKRTGVEFAPTPFEMATEHSFLIRGRNAFFNGSYHPSFLIRGLCHPPSPPRTTQNLQTAEKSRG